MATQETTSTACDALAIPELALNRLLAELSSANDAIVCLESIIGLDGGGGLSHDMVLAARRCLLKISDHVCDAFDGVDLIRRVS